jgi:hypothetical protein
MFLFILWVLSGLLGGTSYILSVNYDAGLPLLKLSDLAYIIIFTIFGPISAFIAGLHLVFLLVQYGVKWLINKYNSGNDTTLIN